MRFITLLLLTTLFAALTAPAGADQRSATSDTDTDVSVADEASVPVRPGARLYATSSVSKKFRSANTDQQNGSATPPGGARAAGLTGAAPDSNAPTGLAARPHATMLEHGDRVADNGLDGLDQTYESADGDGLMHGLLFLLAALIGASWIGGMAEPGRKPARLRL